jgi:nitrate/nitrite transport system substrate-binding protein
MSIFDPYGPARMQEVATCICGRHRSQAEHDHQTRLMLECTPIETVRKHKRFEGVIAEGAMRSAFRRPA